MSDLTVADLQPELRGYEVAKWNGSGWERVAAYQPSGRGLNEATISCARLNDRPSPTTYVVRVVVSMFPPPPTTEETEAAAEGDGGEAGR